MPACRGPAIAKLKPRRHGAASSGARRLEPPPAVWRLAIWASGRLAAGRGCRPGRRGGCRQQSTAAASRRAAEPDCWSTEAGGGGWRRRPGLRMGAAASEQGILSVRSEQQSRVGNWALGPAKRLMGLLGLFLTSRLSLCSCRRRTLPPAAEAPLLCGSLAPGRRGSC